MTTETYAEQFPRGNCQQNARWMTAMYPELTITDGYLVFGEPGTERRMEHTWNVTPGGEIADSTAWAFAGTGAYRYEADPESWNRLAGCLGQLGIP